MPTNEGKTLIGSGILTQKAVTGLVAIATAAGTTALGALCGEVLDWVPYFNHAIPQGLAYVGNIFSDANVTDIVRSVDSNLDKVGASAGFICGLVRSSKVLYTPF